MRSQKPKKPKKQETTGEMVRSFLVAILIALVFRSLAYEPFHIPSGSMLSTLYQGDYIIVSKLSYGYSRYSFPLGIQWFDGRVAETAPKRGDVVVFRNPQQPGTNYIKRLIGFPGDRIQVKDSVLYINGAAVALEELPPAQLAAEDGPNAGAMQFVPRLRETLPGGRGHAVLNMQEGLYDPATGFDADNTPVYTVPPHHYFMMGDNRDRSIDSRFSPANGYPTGPGFVPEENLVGRAEAVIASFRGGVPVWKFWKWPHAFRHERWFTSLRHD